MTHQATCEVCGASASYLSMDLAQVAAVVHVLRHHPTVYEAVCGRPADERLKEMGLPRYEGAA